MSRGCGGWRPWPNVRMKLTFGLRPCQDSNGVMPSTLLVGDLFKMNTAVVTASPQNSPGTFLAFSRLRAMPTIVWLRRSTTPFCCGEYGAVR